MKLVFTVWHAKNMIVIGLLTIFITILGYIFNRVYSTKLCTKMSKRKYKFAKMSLSRPILIRRIKMRVILRDLVGM